MAVKCYVGLGSNLGNRQENLEKAAQELSRNHKILKASPVYQNPAMVPAGAPANWNLAFLNAVLEIETDSAPWNFFRNLKHIEEKLGRTPSARWAPRVIDLDLLLWGDETFDSQELKIPHEGLWDRSFVLDPLKDLAPTLVPPGKNKSVLLRARELQKHSPLWMGILNLTPDSFSDGGNIQNTRQFLLKAEEMKNAGVHVLDLGAESTRPGATALPADEEWKRLQEPLSQLLSVNSGYFKPRISVDTRHAKVAERALELGADWLNDVSGFSSPEMLQLARQSPGPCVFMHSLTVPADPAQTLPHSEDPVVFLKGWALEKIDVLQSHGVSLERLIFDPGIGFGKTETQSLEILKKLREFSELPVPVLVGHSRKSFMRLWTGEKAKNRDGDSVGVSLRLIESKVDILRVHEPSLHLSAFLAWSHL